MILSWPVRGSLKNSGAHVLTGLMVLERVEMVATSVQVIISVLEAMAKFCPVQLVVSVRVPDQLGISFV